MEINILKQLYTDFLKIIEQAVIKYKTRADEFETVETKRAADAYITASRKEDTFETYYRYEASIIAEFFNLSPTSEAVQAYQKDRNLILLGLNSDDEIANRKKEFLTRQRKYIIDHYEEKNNYYRELIGLPNLEDTDFIYVEDDEIAEKYRINKETPIHELNIVQISALQAIGYIDTLYEKYKKEYLRFLGNEKVDLVLARTVKNFSLLKIPYGISEAMWDNFSFLYEQCREYFMSCIYVPEFRQTIERYDNFIALCIMIMAIQQVISRVAKGIINRDFFDPYCVRVLFETYGVPYYNNMDTDTLRIITQELNVLIQNKGTNKVLYDIASLLGYNRIKIYKYYLMKTRKFDFNGYPEVYYKENELGEQVLDYEKMFDIYFQKVEIQDMDTYKSLLHPSNRKAYEEITGGDPFWIEDDDLLKQIYEEEYNFIETKYMGISILYRLNQILFENVYLLRMIFDKKDELPFVSLDLPRISEFDRVSLFDSIVLLCAMICKQNKLKGEILVSPSKILHVIGFNFNKDFSLIREDIQNDPNLDNSLLKYFTNSTVYTAESVNALYLNFKKLYEELTDVMATTQSIDVYMAYNKLYHTIFYTEENREMFCIGEDDDGNKIYATSYLDYLQRMNPNLYSFVEGVEGEKIYDYINHICQRIMSIIPNLKYLGFLSGLSETLEMMLVGLIRFFKSYTTDMIGLDVIYICDMKPELLLRLINGLTAQKTLEPHSYQNFSYTDSLVLHGDAIAKDALAIIDRVRRFYMFAYLYDQKFLEDKLCIHSTLTPENPLNIFDETSFWKDINIATSFFFKNILKIYTKISERDDISLMEVFEFFTKEIISEKTLNLYNEIFSLYKEASLNFGTVDFSDSIQELNASVTPKEFISFGEFVNFSLSLLANSYLSLEDMMKEESTLIGKVLTYYFENAVTIWKNSTIRERFTIRDVLLFLQEIQIKDMNILDAMAFVTNKMLHKDKLHFRDTLKFIYEE